MNDAERFFANVGTKLENIVSAPSKLLNSITNALDSPFLLYAVLGLGGILVIKIIK